MPAIGSLRRRTLRGVQVLVACTAAAAGAYAQDGSAAADAPPRVQTRAGTLEGRALRDVAVFRGIPYAAAPVGALRWRPPQTAAPWSGVRPADAFGKACPQKRELSLDQAGDPGPVDEDCLFLNVWMPRQAADRRLPVMFWIHGGAFVIGAASQPVFDGKAMAARGAVVVTFNYRLGPLGFFSHPALDAAEPGGPANFGLLDQIAALEWVRDNIAAFGGDPGNVTVFGESAGAQSVLALFASPRARGLFHKGIAQSAYGLPSHPRSKARAVGIAIASAAGADGAQATLDELRAVPAAVLTDLSGPALTLAPSLVTGDSVLPQPILATFRQGGEAMLPLIVGSNSDDGSVVAGFGVEPADLVRKMGAARLAVRPFYARGIDDARLGREVARDVVFGVFARRLAYLHATRAPTWRYYFRRLTAGSTQAGVPHGGELESVDGVDDDCRCLAAPLSDADRAIARRIGDYWFAFASSSAPDPAGDVAWPRDGRSQARTMEFGNEFVVRDGFMQRRFDAFIGALKLLEGLPRRR
jgi:para-nitrobenzyl esterase